ncbi:hypothetical protein SEUCBS139899_001991 [Sporothrix eucalyptigena]|uniref:Ubiquitin-like protease family profile domain-containing protein n=1 Tax=Sporothrix eucalyptigena TaxID=1812306 RepID=A0ABP0CN76_9PEZI
MSPMSIKESVRSLYARPPDPWPKLKMQYPEPAFTRPPYRLVYSESKSECSSLSAPELESDHDNADEDLSPPTPACHDTLSRISCPSNFAAELEAHILAKINATDSGSTDASPRPVRRSRKRSSSPLQPLYDGDDDDESDDQRSREKRNLFKRPRHVRFPDAIVISDDEDQEAVNVKVEEVKIEQTEVPMKKEEDVDDDMPFIRRRSKSRPVVVESDDEDETIASAAAAEVNNNESNSNVKIEDEIDEYDIPLAPRRCDKPAKTDSDSGSSKTAKPGSDSVSDSVSGEPQDASSPIAPCPAIPRPFLVPASRSVILPPEELEDRLAALGYMLAEVANTKNADDCPLFVDEQDSLEEVPLMSLAQRSVIVPKAARVLSSASCLARHPHDMDTAAHNGDHLLAHLRPVNKTTGGYLRTKKNTPLDAPRGTVSLDVCPLTQKLDKEAERQLLAAGKRVSTRPAAIQATQDSQLRCEKQHYRNTQLTLEQNASKTHLSYHAVTLTNEDVRVLRNGWLTDNNITFWEEYLEREVLPKYPQARIALLRATFAMVLMAENIDTARKVLPDFRTTTHIFLPISDAKDFSRSESGSHWSLLLVSVIDGVAFHYDSMGMSNLREARNITARMAVLLGIPLRFRHIDDTPQQDNGNDCGVFVCVLMRFLLVKRLLNAHAREKVSMSLGGKMIDAQGGRKEMLRIIENLRREGERRRSTSPFVKKDVPRIE